MRLTPRSRVQAEGGSLGGLQTGDGGSHGSGVGLQMWERGRSPAGLHTLLPRALGDTGNSTVRVQVLPRGSRLCSRRLLWRLGPVTVELLSSWSVGYLEVLKDWLDRPHPGFIFLQMAEASSEMPCDDSPPTSRSGGHLPECNLDSSVQGQGQYSGG